MAENGEDKLFAVARHIAKTLGRTNTMTDDILQIFSNFDGRFSRENLSDAPLDDTAGGGGEHLTFSSIDRTLRSLERQIARSLSSPSPIWSDSADATAFLDSVDALLAVVRELDPAEPADKPLFDRADDLIQQAMLRLEDEFRTLLENPDGSSDPTQSFDSNTEQSDEDEDNEEEYIPVAQPVHDYDFVIDAIPAGAAGDLHDIARRMVSAGFGRECALAYSAARQGFVEESIARLGLRFRTSDEVQATPWVDLEEEIPRWVKSVNVAFRILYPSERGLADRIFLGMAPIADFAFAELCRGSAIQLLGFADAVAAASRAPERLFRIVDMYEAIRELISEIDPLFADQYSSFLQSEVRAIWKGLAAAIRAIFMELENLIRRDPAKAAVPGGGLHPITRYVMNYLRAACASRRTLEEVMEEDAAPAVELDRPSSLLAVQIAWLMDVLQGNLEAKSKIYKDAALSCVFLMNNGRYIIQKVKDSELSLLLGEDWIRRMTVKVRRWSNDYCRSTWGKVVAVLRVDAGAPPMGVKTMRERLRLFNGYLEEIWRVQSGWVVADEQLKTELRLAGSGAVVPAYRSFLGRLRAAAEGRNSEKNVKYRVEEVESRFNELFEGKYGKS